MSIVVTSGGGMGVYPEPASKVASREEQIINRYNMQKKNIMPETRSEPSAPNPHCIGYRLQPKTFTSR